MKHLLLALAFCGFIVDPAIAAPPKIAVFGFELINTSPAASTPEELGRLGQLDQQLAAALGMPGRYNVMALPPPQGQGASIRSCNGCELDAAQKAGADLAAYGWVQKVSNLILNINLVIEDANTGHIIKADSVDIRGNTKESWQRGLRYLINERLFRD
jgi:hypothetical protein